MEISRLVTLAMSIILLGSLSNAEEVASIVECSATVKNKKESVSLKLNRQGKIIFWAEGQIASAQKKSIFGPLAENIDEWGFEYTHSFKAPNGFAIVQAGTTADEISVGISKDLKSGFYRYKDLGSGNGNSQIPLTCKKVRSL